MLGIWLSKKGKTKSVKILVAASALLAGLGILLLV